MNLSLVTVFVSILFMGGLVERLFREFSLTLAAAMLVSLARIADANTQPVLALVEDATHALTRKEMLSALESRRLRAAGAGYARTLGWVLGHAQGMLLVFVGIIALNVSLYYSIPKGFLPNQDTGQLKASSAAMTVFHSK